MANLLAVDLGLRTGLALYRRDGRLAWYRSTHLGTVAALRRALPAWLDACEPDGRLVLEGGGPIAEAWKKAAARRGIATRQLAADDWRAPLLAPSERADRDRAKRGADALARRVIVWSGARRPTSLRHDAAEAILIGLWGVLDAGWLAALPRDLRPDGRGRRASATIDGGGPPGPAQSRRGAPPSRGIAMSTGIGPRSRPAVVYPESDGRPMSDNTLQFQWIVTIKEGLEALYADRPDVFVAGDLLWYPVEGDPRTRIAPDAMVALGRPKGHRGSYRQWEEGGVAPAVVFEVISPGNTAEEMARKRAFYERHGVLEFYLYDPETGALEGWSRGEAAAPLAAIPAMDGWTSPALGIRFERPGGALSLIRPDGRPFQTYLELYRTGRRLEAERDAERARADRLAERLRALGLDPDA